MMRQTMQRGIAGNTRGGIPVAGEVGVRESGMIDQARRGLILQLALSCLLGMLAAPLYADQVEPEPVIEVSDDKPQDDRIEARNGCAN